jgi:hypothetical protein
MCVAEMAGDALAERPGYLDAATAARYAQIVDQMPGETHVLAPVFGLGR